MINYLLNLRGQEVSKLKRASCFELYPSVLDAKIVNKLLIELFPLIHTELNDEGGLNIYITREEYVFVLSELSKLNNYALTMPDDIEDVSLTLTSMPIETVIVERYLILYDLLFDAKCIYKEVDDDTLVSDRDVDGKYAEYIFGNKFSQEYDVDYNYQQFLKKDKD